MTKLFLRQESLLYLDMDRVVEGFGMLIEAKALADDSDTFMKHDSIYNIPSMVSLYSTWSQSTGVICSFIEQLSNSDQYIDTLELFEELHPGCCKAFFGLRREERESQNDAVSVFNQHTFHDFKWSCLCSARQFTSLELAEALHFLHPDITFKQQAMDDIAHWHTSTPVTAIRLHRIIEDIRDHPHTGGIAKTEVLRGQRGVASKRLTDGDRVVYSVNEGVICVHSCRGHYE